MVRRGWLLFVALLIFCSAFAAQTSKSADVVGTWEGSSICTVRPSACHDEHVIYAVTQAPDHKLKMSADKVVNGERQNMGDLDCTYDGRTLKCPFAQGVWAFDISGTKMTGTLKLTDGTLFRKVDAARKDK